MSDRAHRETDDILVELIKRIEKIFKTVSFDEINLVPLYIDGEATQNQRLKRAKDFDEDFLVALIVSAVIESKNETDRALQDIYRLNYGWIDSLSNGTALPLREFDETKIRDSARKTAEKMFKRGYTPEEMKKEFGRLLRKWKNVCIFHARTEATRAESKARLDAMERTNVAGKRWDAIIDRVTRDSHRRIDGEIVALDKRFSNGLLYPGDPEGPPEEVMNCRCTMQPVDKAGLQNALKSGMIGSGGVQMDNTGAGGAIPRSDRDRQQRHANLYYEEMRNRKDDVAAISGNTGFSINDVSDIKNHVFRNTYELGEKNSYQIYAGL